MKSISCNHVDHSQSIRVVLDFIIKFIRQQLEHLENVQGLIEVWTPKQVQRPADTFSNLLCSRDSIMRVDLIM